MAGWAGFTDEELHRLKRGVESGGTLLNKVPSKDVKVANLTSATRRTKEKVYQGQYLKQKKNEAINIADKDAKRGSPLTSDVAPQTCDNESSVKMDHACTDDKVVKTDCEDEKHAATCESKDSQKISQPSLAIKEDISDIRVLTTEETADLELTSLEELQRKQKQIEEENKKKKKLIKDTLQERYKKAQSETQTLQTINKELSHLDERLAADVEILRTKIEEASIDFAHAQRRYDKAEKEFVDSKLDLQLKRDRKDDLTQHLYSIIKENEERKAKKLQNLMTKLNLQPSEDKSQAPQLQEQK